MKNEIKDFLNFVASDEEMPMVLSEIEDTVNYADCNCYALNYLLTRKIFAGFPLGRIITIAGDSASGKTALALQFATIKNFDLVFYIQTNGEDAEKSFVNKFKGIDQNKFVRQTINNFEQLNQLMEKILIWLEQKKQKILIIVDSVSGLSDINIKNDNAGFAGGRRATLFKNLLRNYANKLKNCDSNLILISQYYLNPTASFGQDPKVLGGGLAVKQYSHLILELTALKSDSEILKKNIIGALNQAINIKVSKSRFGTQYSELKIIFDFEATISQTAGLFELCSDLTLIEKKGKMYYFPNLITKKEIENFDVATYPLFGEIDLERDKGFYRKDFEKIINENPAILERILKIIDFNFGAEKIFSEDLIEKIMQRKKSMEKD